MQSVGTRQSFATQTERMLALQAAIEKLQGQISDGKRITEPSDDPIGAQRVAQLSRTLSDNEQFTRNMDAAMTKLTLAESAVGSMANQLVRAKELALLASTETMNESDRKSIATEVGHIIDQMLSFANAQDSDGAYIFAGARAQSPAFGRDADGKIQWQGAGVPPPIAISPDTVLSPTESGAALLGGIAGEDGPITAFTLLEDFHSLVSTPHDGTPEGIEAYRAGIERVLDGLGSAIDQVNDARSAFGARQARIEAEQERLISVGIDLKESRSAIEDMNVAEAITEMQKAMLILQASQQSFARIKSMSLFDMLG